MIKTLNILSLLLAAALVCACSGQRKTTQQPAASCQLPAKEQVWQLVRQQGRPLPANSATITLIVNPEARTANGQAPCNPYSFSCTISNPIHSPEGDFYDLTLKPLGSGSTRCTEAEMNAEQRYLSALARTTRLRLTATTLTLYQKDREILHYELQ